VAGVATVLVTLWIMLTGYRVITGQLREPLMAVVTHMARVVVILSATTTMSVFGANLNTFLTTDLSNEINQVVSGSNDSVYTTIDKNLAYTEVAMSAIDAIQTVPGNTDLANQKAHASFWAGFGTAGPPMTANFFQGTLGNFLHYSAFGSFGTPGPQGQPPGSYTPQNRPPATVPLADAGKTSNNLHPGLRPVSLPTANDTIKPRPMT
jgi:hypothetical protein